MSASPSRHHAPDLRSSLQLRSSSSITCKLAPIRQTYAPSIKRITTAYKDSIYRYPYIHYTIFRVFCTKKWTKQIVYFINIFMLYQSYVFYNAPGCINKMRSTDERSHDNEKRNFIRCRRRPRRSGAYDASCRQNNKKLLSHDRPISAAAEKFSSDQSNKMIALPDK